MDELHYSSIRLHEIGVGKCPYSRFLIHAVNQQEWNQKVFLFKCSGKMTNHEFKGTKFVACPFHVRVSSRRFQPIGFVFLQKDKWYWDLT